jgi:DNA-directed RNA polymerase specialized sigma24 family protein
MRYIWTYSGCDKTDEEQLARLWKDRQAEVDAKVATLSGNDSTLARMLIEHSDDNPAWVIRSVLYLIDGAVASEISHDDLSAALDATVADLSQQLDLLLDQPFDGKQRPREATDKVAQVCASLHRSKRSQDFVATLWPLVRSLSRYARREMQMRQSDGNLPAGRTSVPELLDEVTLAAWEQFSKKPGDLSLQLWLVKLIDEALDRAQQSIAQQSLEDRQPPPDSGIRDVERSEWVEFPTEEESIELSRLIPDSPGLGAWDELDIESKQSQLDDIFNHLPRLQRQVLMLHLVEGFNRAEIADFQDRSESEVDDDLGEAAQIVRRMFQEQGLLQMEEDMHNATHVQTRKSRRS